MLGALTISPGHACVTRTPDYSTEGLLDSAYILDRAVNDNLSAETFPSRLLRKLPNEPLPSDTHALSRLGDPMTC